MFKSLKNFGFYNSPKGEPPNGNVKPKTQQWKPYIIFVIKVVTIVIVTDTLSLLLFEPTYNSGWFAGVAAVTLGNLVNVKEDDNV